MSHESELRRWHNTLAYPSQLDSHRFSRPLLWSMVLLLLGFVAWAALSEIDEVTRGNGRVIPVSRMQKIQSLEGGLLEELMVAEGDLVEAGQVLARIDPTRFRTSLEEAVNQSDGLRAAIARLQAEALRKNSVEYPPEIAKNAGLVRSENALFAARKGKLSESVAALERQILIAQDQLKILEPLASRRAASEMDVLKLRQEVASLRGRATELRSSYLQDAYAELSKKQAELSALEPVARQRSDQLRRTEISSPVRGKVKEVLITTRGGVIQPGEPIMEIVPIEERLLVEARIQPRDVAFLVPGMAARVKITAYDHTMYGDLAGTLEHISADTIVEETIRGQESYYKVLIRTENAHLERGGKVLPIIPGMVAEVDILNGKRTLLNYLLRPLLRASLR